MHVPLHHSLALALALASGAESLLAPAAMAIQFEREENVSETPSASRLPEVTPQAVAVDGAGRVLLVWAEFEDAESPPELWMRARHPETGWAPPVTISLTDGLFSGDGALAVDSAGQAHLAWIDHRGGRLEIWVARLDPEQGKLIDPRAISSAAQLVMDPAIAAGPGGEIAVAWTAMESMNYELKLRLRSGKGEWGATESVTPADRRASDQVAIAYGPDGRLHLAWADNRKGVRRILAAARGPSGYSSPVEVSPVEGPGKQLRPTLAVDPQGEVVIAWQDSREGTEEIYVARSGKSGGIFGPSLRVTRGGGPSRSPCAVSGPDGALHLFFESGSPPGGSGQPGSTGPQASLQIRYARLAPAAARARAPGAGPGLVIADEHLITRELPISSTHPSAVLGAAGSLHLAWLNEGIGDGDVFYGRAASGLGPGAPKAAAKR